MHAGAGAAGLAVDAVASDLSLESLDGEYGVGVGAGLVDEDEGMRSELGHIGAPGCAGGFVALGGEERLFLSGQPIRRSDRDIVAGLSAIPVALAHIAQCSASVASGAARTWATKSGSYS